MALTDAHLTPTTIRFSRRSANVTTSVCKLRGSCLDCLFDTLSNVTGQHFNLLPFLHLDIRQFPMHRSKSKENKMSPVKKVPYTLKSLNSYSHPCNTNTNNCQSREQFGSIGIFIRHYGRNGRFS